MVGSESLILPLWYQRLPIIGRSPPGAEAGVREAREQRLAFRGHRGRRCESDTDILDYTLGLAGFSNPGPRPRKEARTSCMVTGPLTGSSGSISRVRAAHSDPILSLTAIRMRVLVTVRTLRTETEADHQHWL